MNKKHNILVTGCGGDIGQSIGKILKSHPMFGSVIGCDMSEQHPGKFIFERCLKIPAISSDKYQSTLEGFIKEFNIDIILPASEPELRYYTKNNICDNFLGVLLVSANIKAMEIGFDKLLTAKFLKEKGLPFPLTQVAGEVTQPELPVIMKSRSGSGSKSLFLIEDIHDFNFYRAKHPDYIIQEFIKNGDAEFTCGLFRDLKGNIRTISYKRKLIGGFSGFGEVVQNDEIDRLLLTIGEKLNLRGSINIQLRLSDRGPLVFEINPRFSSTVMFRHLMGFEDVLWSIQDRLGEEIADYSAPATGRKFYKGFSEYVD